MNKYILLIILVLSNYSTAQIIQATSLAQVNTFINKMVKKHEFIKQELVFLFNKIELKIKKPSNKAKKKYKPVTWGKFANIFLTKQRIDNGAKFLQHNYTTLQRAENKFGVQKSIIVAILGIETNYGKNTGKYPTMKTLTALAFGKNHRQKFYKKELEEFLLMARKNDLAPLLINGSYAGAMGMAQFISSSYNYYAIDFNNDGIINLFNTEDAIGSIANYFFQHRWQRNGEFAINVSDTYQKFANKRPNKPKYTNKKWQEKGVFIQNIATDKKYSFIQLTNIKTIETWLTFWNFYIITRYNHDNKYAMAVVSLADEIIKRTKKL